MLPNKIYIPILTVVFLILYYYYYTILLIILSFQAASPACTELETIVLDWFGKMIGLPQDFLAYGKNSKGGGVIQVRLFAGLHFRGTWTTTCFFFLTLLNTMRPYSLKTGGILS